MKITSALNTKKERRNHKCSLGLIVFFLFFTSLVSYAQLEYEKILNLNRQQYEELFLKQNLLLLAQKYNINQAEAMLLQAKLWPNPNLSIEDVNLWNSKKQLANMDDALPPIFGNVAKNTQFAIQIEQHIPLGGKRRKAMAIEKTSVEIAKQDFQELLRNLKFDFRNKLTQLQYLQTYSQVFAHQQKSVTDLLKSYKKQYERDNLSKGEYVRLQILQLEISKEINDLKKEKHELEAEIKTLLSIDDATSIGIKEDNFIPNLLILKNLDFDTIYTQALEARPDMARAALEHEQYAKLLKFERAQNIPDVALSASYDRGGGIWPSFFGFGLAIDLPIFNQNQGNIKYAKEGIDQSKILFEEIHVRIKNEIYQNLKDLLSSIELYESIAQDYEQDLDQILESYTRNFTNRNLSLLEYLDFQGAYLENKKIIIASQRDIHLHLEMLQHSIGTEI